MADTSVNSPPSPVSARSARADSALRVLTMITLAMVGLQFMLAGFGVFGAGFDMHIMLGRTIGWFSLLPLIAAIVARAGKADITIAVVVSLLAIVVQGILAQVGMNNSIPILGALHVLTGLAIGGLLGQLLEHANQRRKLRTKSA